MISRSPIPRDGGHSVRSLTLGPTCSTLWTLGLGLVLFLAARATYEEAPGPIATNGPARPTALTWPGHPIYAMAWSPDGRRLAASGWGSRVRVWEWETGMARSFESEDGLPRFVLGWWPDGRGIALSDLEGRVETWEAVEGRGPSPARPPDDVRAIASTTRGASLRLWGPTDGRSRLLPPVARSARAMALTPDGRTIASAGLEGIVRIWETGSGILRRAISNGGVGFSVIAFSPDGTRLGSGGGGPARVWDVASGRELTRVGDPGSGFSTLAFSPDGRRLAGASWGGRVQVWDLETGRELMTLGRHEAQVVTMAWSPDGRRLASAGHDAIVRIWDLDQDH